MRSVARSLVGLAVLLFALPASAAPIVYGENQSVSTITIQARTSIGDVLIFNETLDLSTDSYATWDAAGIPDSAPAGGTGTLDDFLFRIIPGQGPFSTVAPFGPYDEITIVSGDINPHATSPYSTLFIFPAGGTTVNFAVGAIDIDAYYDASNSGGSPAPSGPTAADITGITNMSGNATFTAGSIQLEISGLVMGVVDGTPFGEVEDLNLTANISFHGSSNVTPTPEPSTGLLVALGLAGLGARRRRTSVR